MGAWTAACAVFAIAATFAAAPEATAKTKGKIKSGTYTSPAENFSVPVPSGPGMKATDAYDADAGIGAVSFHDDFGNLVAILYMSVPPEAAAALADSARQRESMEGFLEEVAMPTWFLPASKDAKILHQEFAGTEDSVRFVGLVDIPGGSTAVDVATGKRFNSRRAVLTLYHAGFAYALNTEVGGPAFRFLNDAEPDPMKQLALGRSRLIQFLHTIRFRRPG